MIVLLKYLFLINPPTTLNLQRAGLGVQRKAAEVHVAHGSDSDSAGNTKKNIHRNLTSSSDSCMLELQQSVDSSISC